MVIDMAHLDNPLEVIAASLALPIVERELDQETKTYDHNRNISAKVEMNYLLQRRFDLINIIKGKTDGR